MQPINYNLQNPTEALMGGLKYGATLTGIEQQAEQYEAAKIKEAQALAAQQQMQTDLRGLWSNPNAGHAEFAGVMTKYPQLAENIGKAFKVWDEGKQRTALEFGSRVYGALQSGNKDLAVELMKQRAKADPSSAGEMQMMADVAETDPRAAKVMWATTLAGMMGPEKFAEGFAKLGEAQRATDKAPAELRKATADAAKTEAEAIIKGEEAKVADQAVLLDLQKKGWDIRKIQEDIDIAKQANRIAAMSAAFSREGNDLKRQELRLKVQEAEQKLASDVRDKVATVEAARTGMDNMINTIDRVLSNKSLNDVIGSLEGRMPAAVGSALDDEESDAIALIDTLKSQAFISQIPNIKGMGALSNAEGEKLQAALQNLDRAQSEKQFRASLKEAQRLVLKGRKNLVTRYGVAESVPDTPAAARATSPADIDALVKKYAK